MKKELKEILKNPRKKLIAIDMDETLAIGTLWKKEDLLEPNKKMVKLIQDLYNNGGHIIIYTARQPRLYPVTLAWLIKYEVPFHGIAMQVKIGADLYIDDKALNIEDVI